jgi:hypothetical protein
MAKQLPIAAVTNPILLWLYEHGWEDPDWGHRPAEQLTIALAIHEFAGMLTDTDATAQIQTVTKKTVATLSRKLVGER